MEVVFIRTGERRYAVEARRDDGGVVRMDPAPGYDDYFPHDLQHLIVEEQLGLANGIFGRLAQGGTASTFAAVASRGSQNKRAAARARRKAKQRNLKVAAQEPSDFGRSERATLAAWHDWLSHCPEAELQHQAHAMASDVHSLLSRLDPAERDALQDALPSMRARIDAVARRWSTLDIGDHLAITWCPVT